MGDEEEGTTLAAMPPSLGGPAPAAPAGGPAPAPGVPGLPPLPVKKEPEEPEGLQLEELEALVGMGYAGAMEGIVLWKTGRHFPYPEEAAAKRGKAIALALKKLGYLDEEIVLLVSLGGGLIMDAGWVQRCIKEAEAEAPPEAQKKAKPAPRGAAPAPDEAPAESEELPDVQPRRKDGRRP